MSKYLSVYKEQNEKFEKLNLQDSLATYKGFIGVYIARGAKSDDKNIIDNARAYLNDDDTLPGVVVAYLVKDAIDFEEAYKSNTLSDMFLDGDDGSSLCLQYIADFCYGVTQALMSENTFKNDDFILDFINTVAEISQLDSESEFDNDLYISLKDYLVSSLMTIYKDTNK